MEAAARRKRMLDAMYALTLRSVRIRPVISVIEDLHWIDRSTEESLGLVVDAAAGLPLMFLFTYRVGYTPPIESRSFHTTLTLQSLPEAESLAMAGHVLGMEQFPEELKASLMEKAEGVPLFVEEVTKTLLDLGALQETKSGSRTVNVTEVSVPETIQEIIMARLDQLGEAGKRTVQLASVIGRQFLVRLLERVSGLTGQLDGLLAELQSLEVVYRQGLLPEPAYIFKHAVIQDVAYNSLLLQRRKELHQAVGTAIEELYPERLAEHYEELAHHFDHGEVWSKAMEYGVLAGDRAADAYANTEARAHYARALRAAEHMAPSLEPGIIARIRVKYGQVLTVLGEYEEAATAYQCALELVRQVGDRRHEVEVLVWLSTVYDFSHQAEPAIEYNEQALTIARELGDQGAQAICLANRVATRTAGYGQIIETTPDAEEALRLSRKIGTPQLLAKALVFLGGALQWRADFDRSFEYLHEGMQAAEQAHAGFLFGYGVFHTGHAYLAKGEYEKALQLYRRLNEYASAAGDAFWIARAPNCIGGVHLELFSLDEAIQLNLEAEEMARQTWPWPEPRGHCLLKVGSAHFQRDEHGRAEEFFRSAWSLLEEDVWYRWRWHIPLLHARGELALSEGRHDEAWNYATESLELATRTDSRKHLARAQRLQGQILAASGRLEEGERYLETSLQLSTRLGVPQDIWRGKAALAKLQATLGKETEAEALVTQAVQTVEAIADKLRTPSLRQSLLGAEPVLEVYRALGRRPSPA